jgi:hypothetical protein
LLRQGLYARRARANRIGGPCAKKGLIGCELANATENETAADKLSSAYFIC